MIHLLGLLTLRYKRNNLLASTITATTAAKWGTVHCCQKSNENSLDLAPWTSARFLSLFNFIISVTIILFLNPSLKYVDSPVECPYVHINFDVTITKYALGVRFSAVALLPFNQLRCYLIYIYKHSQFYYFFSGKGGWALTHKINVTTD